MSLRVSLDDVMLKTYTCHDVATSSIEYKTYQDTWWNWRSFRVRPATWLAFQHQTTTLHQLKTWIHARERKLNFIVQTAIACLLCSTRVQRESSVLRMHFRVFLLLLATAASVSVCTRYDDVPWVHAAGDRRRYDCAFFHRIAFENASLANAENGHWQRPTEWKGGPVDWFLVALRSVNEDTFLPQQADGDSCEILISDLSGGCRGTVVLCTIVFLMVSGIFRSWNQQRH